MALDHPSASASLSGLSVNSNATIADLILEELPIDLSGVDQQQCQLLGPLALVVQALMGLLVLASLVIKRARENPRRPWRIWSADVSKQVLGQMFIHGCNVLISDMIANHSSEKSNPCTLYFLNIMVDTTLGILILYFFLRLASFILIQRLGLDGFETGQYGNPPQLGTWSKQCAVYIVALTLMKTVVVATFTIFPQAYRVGDWLLTWLGNSPDGQVVFTMMICPIVMNIFQFLVVDSFLKGHSTFQLLPDDEERAPPARDTRSSESARDDEHHGRLSTDSKEDEDGQVVKVSDALTHFTLAHRRPSYEFDGQHPKERSREYELPDSTVETGLLSPTISRPSSRQSRHPAK